MEQTKRDKKTSYLINNSKQYLHFENKNFLANNSTLLDSKINEIKKLFENQQYVECEKKCNSLIKSNFNSKLIKRSLNKRYILII